MAPLLDDAAATADLRGACTRAGVTLVELQRARARDRAFDLAMGEVDEALRLAAHAQVVAAAAAGDLRAVGLLSAGKLAPPAPPAGLMAPHVAAAALAAADGRAACPHCRRPFLPEWEYDPPAAQAGDHPGGPGA